MLDYYEILGVARTATQSEIKAAYRRGAMRWHPDRNPGNEEYAARQFKDLAHAYAILGDSDKRRAYDETFTAHSGKQTEPEQQDDDIYMEEAARIFLEEMTELATTLAAGGHNPDVIFGALLSQGCPESVARRIAHMAAGNHRSNSDARTKADSASTSKSSLSITSVLMQGFATVKRLALRLTVVVVCVMVGKFIIGVMKDESTRSYNPASVSSQSLQQPEQAAPMLSAIQQQIPGYDETTQSGTIFYSEGPVNADWWGTAKNYLGTPFTIRLMRKEEVPQSPSRTLYFFTSTPNTSDKFECHVCRPIVSLMMVARDEQGREKVTIPLTPVDAMGGFGNYTMADQPTKFVEIGSNGKLGIPFFDSYMGMGERTSWWTIVAIESNAFRLLGHLPDAFEHSGRFDCSVPGNCAKWGANLTFQKTGNAEYYPVLVTKSGFEYDDDYEIQPVEAPFVLRFDGAKYARIEPPARRTRPDSVGMELGCSEPNQAQGCTSGQAYFEGNEKFAKAMRSVIVSNDLDPSLMPGTWGGLVGVRISGNAYTASYVCPKGRCEDSRLDFLYLPWYHRIVGIYRGKSATGEDVRSIIGNPTDEERRILFELTPRSQA